ncbi:MAG: hypothetical protein NUV34_09375, partial [Sulfuricaulis sp.]|nr:hypothetical protein [Sulfuricaulis sp.]
GGIHELLQLLEMLVHRPVARARGNARSARALERSPDEQYALDGRGQLNEVARYGKVRVIRAARWTKD